MYKSRATSVNYPGNQYRDLNRYYGILPGQVGTVTGSNGETQSIPIPAFAPPMNQQTVPTYHVDYIGTPTDLMHGLRAEQLTSGYFPVGNAYASACTTFRKRGCDGVVPQNQIPIPDRCPGCGGPGLAPCPCGDGNRQAPILPGVVTPHSLPHPIRESPDRGIHRESPDRGIHRESPDKQNVWMVGTTAATANSAGGGGGPATSAGQNPVVQPMMLSTGSPATVMPSSRPSGELQHNNNTSTTLRACADSASCETLGAEKPVIA